MADSYNVTRLGQLNLTGDERALFMKQFSGEVMTEFETQNKMIDKVRTRNITKGKSSSFPLIGKVDASYHTPGDELTGKKVEHGERIINIDALLVSDVFIDNLDEAMLHFEVRSEYANEMARKLSKVMDINLFSETIKGARSSATLTKGNGGTEIANDKFQIDGGTAGSANLNEQIEALTSAIFKIAETFDEKDVPEEERYVAFRPAEYYALAQNLDLINSLYKGQGAIAEGNVIKVAGITIVKSNNVPKIDSTSTNTYHGVDATKTVGIAWQKQAVGLVKLLDLATESAYQVERQGTLLVAKYAVGMGVLRPECAIELKLNTLTNP